MCSCHRTKTGADTPILPSIPLGWGFLGKVIHSCGEPSPCPRSPSVRTPSVAASPPGSRSVTPHRLGSRGWPQEGQPRPPPPCGWPRNDITMVRASPPPTCSPACCPGQRPAWFRQDQLHPQLPPRFSCPESLLVTQSFPLTSNPPPTKSSIRQNQPEGLGAQRHAKQETETALWVSVVPGSISRNLHKKTAFPPSGCCPPCLVGSPSG